jgi:hypothetical protein
MQFSGGGSGSDSEVMLLWQVIAELDVFAEVGSNSALILSATTTVSSDGTLAVVFEGVIGSPTISAICVRSGQQNDLLEKRRIDSGAHSSTCTGALVREAPEYKGYQQEVQEKDQEIQQITEYKSRRQQVVCLSLHYPID